MLNAHRRNPLISWWIGLALIIACVGAVAWQMQTGACAAPFGAQLIVLFVVPIVYLALMYLTFKSQP